MIAVNKRGLFCRGVIAQFVASFFAVIVVWTVDMGEAEAIPAFARKYDMTCNVCHTRQPRLNTFGQRFLENGYQLPGTEDGGVTGKRLLGGETGGVTLDYVSNFLAVRLRADIQKASFDEKTEASDDVDIIFPNVINLFFAGTVAKNMSFFLEGEFATQEGHEAALAFERALIVFNNIGGHQVANVKIGQFDPSAFFSFPTHRQQINPIPPQAHTDGFPPEINRAPLLPLAFASKMFGLTRGPGLGGVGDSIGMFNPKMAGAIATYEGEGDDGFSILPFEPLFYNAPFSRGVSIHGRPFGTSFLYQVGVVQDETADNDPETRWDTYAMLRYDKHLGDYSALQVSGFYYHSPNSARATLAPPPLGGAVIFSENTLDWNRFGIGARLQHKYLDLYGTVIWDQIDSPSFGNKVVDTGVWETDAVGVSIEADWLISQKWMLGVRYDYMQTGGLSLLPKPFRAEGGDPELNQDASFIAIIAKYYPWPNAAFYGRAHFNLRDSVSLPAALGGGEHPATNLKSMFTVGMDMAF